MKGKTLKASDLRGCAGLAALGLLMAACGGTSANQPSSLSHTAPASASTATLPALQLGYAAGSAVQGALYVAADQGLFEKAGVKVQVSAVKTTAQMAALTSGDLQLASVGGAELVNADLAGASAVMVAVSSDYPLLSLYVDKSVKSVNDLVGQSIGITGAGSSTDAMAQLILKHYNLTGRVKIVPTGDANTAVLAALNQKLVSAGVLSPPSTEQAARAGFVELVNGIRMGEPFTHQGLIVTKGYLNAHRDAITSFLKAYQEGWTYAAQAGNQAAVIAALARYSDSPPDVAKVAYDYMLPVWAGKKTPTVDPRGIASSIALSTNPKAKDAKPEDFIDNSLLEGIAKP
jgi:ABC-type nitrate/sulfonate/bicarbonate transport system substrate-binding protein